MTWWCWRRSYPKAAEYPDPEEYPKAVEYRDETECLRKAAEYPGEEEEYPSPRVELNLFKQVSCWTRAANKYLKFPWNPLHMSILGGYFCNLSSTCDFPELPCARFLISHQLHQWEQWEPHIVISFIQELKEMFVVPTLNTFHQTLDWITRFHLLEAFLTLLLQLLHHKTDAILDPFPDRIENLEKELRSILTILGDISWTLESEFQNLLPEFEAMANQAGSLVHYLFFSADRSIGKTDEGISAVFNKIDLLKADLKSSISVPACTTPTTSIVDAILILDSVVDDLEDLLNREDDPIPDVKDQINLLHHELLLSHSSIKDMRSPQPSEIEELKEALMRIGGIAHQAEYLITSFMVKDAPLWYVINRLNHLIQKVEIIRTELQVIAQNYRFGGLKVMECFIAEVPLHDRRVDDVTVGFEDKTMDILDQLVGGGTESLQVISIMGMPGLGKTTLANKLYNHPLVDYTFVKLTWCVVSQTYKRRSVLANILIHINSKLRKDDILRMEEISLKEHIHKTLMGRRYLIVLDDIWDSNVLDELLGCFPDDRNGSRVLFISRNKDVAPPKSIIHELPFLSDEQCWELLEMKVFGNRSCPAALQGIGKKIAARCCRLPLTVVVIAGVLSAVDEDESIWEEVGRSLGSYIDGEDNSVMQILELSYKHLLDHLKPCFLYFGEFKEDEAISIGNLKRLWVAEGFIRKEKDKSAENIAGEYLMELIDKSMVMIGKRRIDGRGAKTCVVHDLLRDLCLKKSKEECFLKYWNSNYHTIYERGHRVRTFEKAATLSYCQHVRSFVGECLSDSFYVRDMRLLRVLHFKTIDGFDKRTFGIEYLVNLRFLVIDSLPTWIDRLVNLEYVRVEESQTYLPPAIVKMKRLRYLRASDAEYGNDWNISNQTNMLEYLSEVRIRKVKDEELLKCSPHLRKLKCCYDPDEMDEKRTCPQFDLRFLTQLDSLYINGVLRKDFGFPSNIVKLTLRMPGLPWEQMSIVGRLEFLEVLKLRIYAFKGKRWDTGDGEFQKLKFLQLENLRPLSEWNVASNEPFPKLQQLILINCSQLQEIPSEIGEITTLELIEVKQGCSYSLVKSAERIKEEQRDMGNEELRVNISTADDW